MTAFVVAATFSTVVALLLVPEHEAGTKEWMLGVLVVLAAVSGWICGTAVGDARSGKGGERPLSNRAQITQSMFTLCGLVVALAVFTSWKFQESAKRRAELAVSVPTSVHSASDCFLSVSRTMVVPYNVTLNRLIELGKKGAGEAKACDGHLRHLRVQAFVSRSAMDVELGNGLREYAGWLEERFGRYAAVSDAVLAKRIDDWFDQKGLSLAPTEREKILRNTLLDSGADAEVPVIISGPFGALKVPNEEEIRKPTRRVRAKNDEFVARAARELDPYLQYELRLF